VRNSSPMAKPINRSPAELSILLWVYIMHSYHVDALLVTQKGCRCEVKKAVFRQKDESAVRDTRESAFRVNRNATVIREANAYAYASRTGTDTSFKKSGERSGWRDHFQTAVGLLLMSAIAIGGLEVFARLCANTGMIR